MKDLSAVCDCGSEALILNENSVVAEAPLSVPDITPVDVFKDKPPGNEPDCNAYVIVWPPSVATTVEEIDDPPAKVPRVPAAVVQTGPSETVNAEPELTASPSGFWICMK